MAKRRDSRPIVEKEPVKVERELVCEFDSPSQQRKIKFTEDRKQRKSYQDSQDFSLKKRKSKTFKSRQVRDKRLS